MGTKADDFLDATPDTADQFLDSPAGSATAASKGLSWDQLLRIGLGAVDPLSAGVAENALSLGNGMLAMPVNEAVKGYREMTDQPAGADVIPTYQPKTEAGQAIQQGIGTIMSPIGKVLDSATGVNSPDAPHRATGHFINAAAGVLPGIDYAKGVVSSGAAAANALRSTADIKAASQAAYRSAKSGSGIVAQQSLGDFAQDVQNMLTSEGVRPSSHPETMKAFDEITADATQPGVAGQSLTGVDSLRKTLSAFRSNAKPGSMDARTTGMILDKYDDYVANLDKSDLVGGVGNADETAKDFAQAQKDWATLKSSTAIDKAIEKAADATSNFTQAGSDNALRLQFKALKNSPEFDRFSPDEQAAITRVVRGDTTQKILTLASKLSPRGVVGGAASAIIGNLLGGPMGVVGTMAGGELARRLADARRLAAANRVSALVRSGGQIPQAPPVAISGEALAPALVLGQQQSQGVPPSMLDSLVRRYGLQAVP